jgi:hypothetical protein
MALIASPARRSAHISSGAKRKAATMAASTDFREPASDKQSELTFYAVILLFEVHVATSFVLFHGGCVQSERLLDYLREARGVRLTLNFLEVAP